MNEFNDGPLTLDEQIKIVSLMENPPEAAMVRKALRFYEPPGGMAYKWGDNTHLIEVLRHYASPQNEQELGQMLALIEGKTALLEIGSSFGGTLKRMASVMKKGARIVSVDMPVDATPKFLNPLHSLKTVCKQLSWLGANVELFVGDSHSQPVIDAVSNFAPYDFVFIDGDHSYEGMMADWKNYGPMGKVVGFHDVGGALPDCQRAWEEIKASGYRTEEFINRESKYMFGIGIVYRE